MQHPNGQGKLVRVTAGAVLDVAVDVRPSSPTYKNWVSFVLSAENHRQVYVPPAFLHGFCVLGDEPADFLYGVTDYYNVETEKSVAWNDEELKELRSDYDIEKHFTPSYEPWDQRLCLVPNSYI